MFKPGWQAGSLYQRRALPQAKDRTPHDNDNNSDGGTSNEDTEDNDDVSPWDRRPTSKKGAKAPRRSTIAGRLPQWSQSPIQTPTATNTDSRVNKLAINRPPRLSISTAQGRKRGATIPDRFHSLDLDELFSDSSESPQSPVQRFRSTRYDSEDEDWAPPSSRDHREVTDAAASRVQSQYKNFTTPDTSDPKISRRLSGTTEDQDTPQSHEVALAVAELGFLGRPSSIKEDNGRPEGLGLLRTDSELASSISIEDLAESPVSSPIDPELRFSSQLTGSSSSDNSSSGATSPWAGLIGTPNSVVGDMFTGSFSAPTSSSLPVRELADPSDGQPLGNGTLSPSFWYPPEYSISAVQQGSHRESGRDTMIALSDVQIWKQAVEEQLERQRTEHQKTLQDHTAKEETLEREVQDLLIQGKEQEASHNNDKIELVKLLREKHEAEEMLNRAVAEYRQRLQAVGIMAEDNAQPTWEVDSDGRQTKPLYKDFPNVTRESKINMLLNRANCKFMLADYEEMSKIAFEALSVAESLHFQPLSARCNFSIGIAFFHSRRFSEAHSRFWLAQSCGGKYGISIECIKEWLKRCNDGIAKDLSEDTYSPIRIAYSGGNDRLVDKRFRAESFFARAPIGASDLRSTDFDSIGNVKRIEGYEVCPSEGYDDESDEYEGTSGLNAEGAKQRSLEEELSLSDAASSLEDDTVCYSGEDDLKSNEVVERLSPMAQNILGKDKPGECASQDHDTDCADMSDVKAKAFFVKDSVGDSFSGDRHNKVVDIVRGKRDGSTGLRFEGEQFPQGSDPEHPSTLLSYEIAQANNAEQKPDWIAIPERTHAVASSDLEKAALKTAKYSDVNRLKSPLSDLTKDMDIPIRDMGAWANRSTIKRLEEAANGSLRRTQCNAFILYRSAYAARAKVYTNSEDPRVLSSLAKDSWKLEPQNIRDQYEAWANLERRNHANHSQVSEG